MKDPRIIEANNLPVEDKVYLKKDMFGYRVVEPIFEDNGKIKWKRIILGTWRERAFLLFIGMIVLFGYLAFDEQLNNYYDVMNNPCAYCNSCQEQTRGVLREMSNADVKNRFGRVNISAIFSNQTNLSN